MLHASLDVGQVQEAVASHLPLTTWLQSQAESSIAYHEQQVKEWRKVMEGLRKQSQLPTDQTTDAATTTTQIHNTNIHTQRPTSTLNAWSNAASSASASSSPPVPPASSDSSTTATASTNADEPDSSSTPATAVSAKASFLSQLNNQLGSSFTRSAASSLDQGSRIHPPPTFDRAPTMPELIHAKRPNTAGRRRRPSLIKRMSLIMDITTMHQNQQAEKFSSSIKLQAGANGHADPSTVVEEHHSDHEVDDDAVTDDLPSTSSSPSPAPSIRVFLGGACGTTTWRKDEAIPQLQEAGITFYDPQVKEWRQELVAIEGNMKAGCAILFFVIGSKTRALASMIEAAALIAAGRRVVLVIEPVEEGIEIEGLVPSASELKDLNRAREYLKDVAAHYSVPVHGTTDAGIKAIIALEEDERRDLAMQRMNSAPVSGTTTPGGAFTDARGSILSASPSHHHQHSNSHAQYAAAQKEHLARQAQQHAATGGAPAGYLSPTHKNHSTAAVQFQTPMRPTSDGATQ